MARLQQLRATIAVLVYLIAIVGVFPCVAAAHGPEAPIASGYLAKVTAVPPGLDAKVIDGDQRMWLRVPRGKTVTVLDYRGAPYLRFARGGVEVNRNSAMYYLNRTPFAETPPPGLTAGTQPNWQRVSSGDEYGWHDGRLHALATVSIAPGQEFVGKWTIPLLVDGHLGAISGGLWHAQDPPIVWFWSILVLLACALAAWRVRSPVLDRRCMVVLGAVSLSAIAVAAAARGLHGRPTVSVFQLIELILIQAFVVWGLHRVLSGRAWFLSYFVIAFVAIWQGAELVPALLQGFVLTAVPPFAARAAAVLGLGGGLGLLLFAMRLGGRRDALSSSAHNTITELGEDDSAWGSI